MNKKLAVSTAFEPVGLPSGKKIYKIPDGRFAGRLVALMQTSPSEIKLSYADSPYATWSSPLTVINDAADDAFDAQMDNAGNLYIVYADQTTRNLASKTLTYADGNWTIGSKVLVYNGGASYTPSIGVELSGKLWVTWSRYSAPNRYIQVKSSSDSGATWGSGASDVGTQLTTGSSISLSKLLVTPTYIHVIATYNNSGIVIRSLPVSGGSWSSEQTIATTTSAIGTEFDAAASDDGRIAIVYNDPLFKYREYDGANWGGIVTFVDNSVVSPQVFFRSGVPVVIYLEGWEGVQKILMYTDKRSGQFSTPVALDNRAKTFDRALLYNQAASTFVDITAAAESIATGDMFHPASSCLLKNQGDQLYIGMQQQFRYLQILLSTLGSGGTTVFSYWDGANWRAFTPSSGAVALDTDPTRIVLWDDYLSIPADWQKSSVDGKFHFWVRIEVNTPFTTGPVGTQGTSISEMIRAIFRRG